MRERVVSRIQDHTITFIIITYIIVALLDSSFVPLGICIVLEASVKKGIAVVEYDINWDIHVCVILGKALHDRLPQSTIMMRSWLHMVIEVHISNVSHTKHDQMRVL